MHYLDTYIEAVRTYEACVIQVMSTCSYSRNECNVSYWYSIRI